MAKLTTQDIYNKAKPELKQQFKQIINDPHSSGLSQKQASKIENLNSIEKKIYWKAFKGGAKHKIAENFEETSLVTKTLDELLRSLENIHAKIHNKTEFKKLIKDPGKLSIAAQDDLKALKPSEQEQLWKQLKTRTGIEEGGILGTIMESLESIERTVVPIVEKIFAIFFNLGGKNVIELVERLLDTEDKIDEEEEEVSTSSTTPLKPAEVPSEIKVTDSTAEKQQEAPGSAKSPLAIASTTLPTISSAATTEVPPTEVETKLSGDHASANDGH